MARKSRRVCLIPPYWSIQEIQNYNCIDGGGHTHVPRQYAEELIGLHVAEWVVDNRIVRLTRVIGIRGLSCKVGEELVLALSRKELWAKVMLSEILGECPYTVSTAIEAIKPFFRGELCSPK